MLILDHCGAPREICARRRGLTAEAQERIHHRGTEHAEKRKKPQMDTDGHRWFGRAHRRGAEIAEGKKKPQMDTDEH